MGTATPHDAAELMRPTTKATTKSTRVLAANTGKRCGTAVKDERIIPVENSPLITSTPSTAMMSEAKVSPAVAAVVVKLAACASTATRCAAETRSTKADLSGMANATSDAMPTTSTTALIRVQNVDRRVRSLIHSERTTRGKLSRPSEECGWVAPGVDAVAVLIG